MIFKIIFILYYIFYVVLAIKIVNNSRYVSLYHEYGEGVIRTDKVDDFVACEVWVNGQWKNISDYKNLKMNPPKKFPTCLKSFYDMAHIPVCGKPEYPGFKFCAKAQYFKLREYTESSQVYMKKIILLIDGCVRCNDPSKMKNVTIKIKMDKPSIATKINENVVQTDMRGNFMISDVDVYDIHRVQNLNNFLIELKHQCNPYNQWQTKKIRLPDLEVDDLWLHIWESTATWIPLEQEERVQMMNFADLPGKRPFF